MADKENYLVAIDILRCHLGKSYEEACEVLGLDAGVGHRLREQSTRSDNGYTASAE
ncbi:hypothetical protein [Plesiomonas shigelloides]|uniref:hypothetical protein n=1 Tax=Plesiomonas shigelloides TaxID=703 RepID=UPI0015B5DB1A|nr:hypothetical protein [Plesiomonas shigelloides]